MKILCFKFQHNSTINEKFDFFEGVGGQEDPIYKLLSLLLLNMKILCFKFQQNHTINEDFDFWGAGEGGPNSKF